MSQALSPSLSVPPGAPVPNTELSTPNEATGVMPGARTMESVRAPVWIYNTHLEADEAIQALHRGGFDVCKLSLIGKGYHSVEHPVGFYTAGDRIKSWGGLGAFWGGIWGLLIGPAVFMLPGVGLVALAGPVVATLVGALEGAVVVGGLSALAAALTQAGVPAEQAIRYETALKADKYILMAHGSDADVAQAHALLAGARAWKVA